MASVDDLRSDVYGIQVKKHVPVDVPGENQDSFCFVIVARRAYLTLTTQFITRCLLLPSSRVFLLLFPPPSLPPRNPCRTHPTHA